MIEYGVREQRRTWHRNDSELGEGLSMNIQQKLQDYRERVEQDLKGNILPFWMKYGIDHETGGFHGQMRADLTVDPTVVRSLVLCSRLVWTFAKAYNFYGDERYKQH